MIIIKKLHDADVIRNPKHRVFIRQHFKDVTDFTPSNYIYNPEADGWIVYFEEGDDLLGECQDACMWKETQGMCHIQELNEPGWEGPTQYMDGMFWALYLANNQFGISYFIPDEPWLNVWVRDMLMDNLEDPHAYSEKKSF